MNDLIEALTIFAKYQKDTRWPTYCEHDVLYIMGVTRAEVSADDTERLIALGFVPPEEDDDDGAWCSFRFGSA